MGGRSYINFIKRGPLFEKGIQWREKAVTVKTNLSLSVILCGCYVPGCIRTFNAFMASIRGKLCIKLLAVIQ